MLTQNITKLTSAVDELSARDRMRGYFLARNVVATADRLSAYINKTVSRWLQANMRGFTPRYEGIHPPKPEWANDMDDQ